MGQRGMGGMVILLVLVAGAACGGPAGDRPVIGGQIADDAITLDRSVGPDDITFDLTNTGRRPCHLYIFTIEKLNGPVDVKRLPVAGGRVDFEASDFYDLSYGPGIEGGEGPMAPSERRSVPIGYNGTPTPQVRVILCNGDGDYAAGRYAVYRTDGT